MSNFLTCCLLTILFLLPISFAKYRVDPRYQHERVYAVVPLVGKGIAEDPVRPAHLPIRPDGRIDPESGILGLTKQLTDDGKFALVEFVARNRSAFAGPFADKTPGVKFFEKGKIKKDDIEKEFRKFKKDFTIDGMGTTCRESLLVVPPRTGGLAANGRVFILRYRQYHHLRHDEVDAYLGASELAQRYGFTFNP